MRRIHLIALAALLLTVFSTEAKAQKGYEFSVEMLGSKGLGRVSNNYVGLNVINGYKFNWGNGFFVGVGAGMEMTSYLTYFKKVTPIDGARDFDSLRESGNFFVPVTGTLQYYLEKGKTVLPFIRLDVGYEFAVFRYDSELKGFDKSSQKGGMIVEPSFGMNFKTRGADRHRAFYATIGPNFQRCVFERIEITGLATPDDDRFVGKTYAKTNNWLLPGLCLRAGYCF
ncbi:MAG: hypothetical protein HUJ91_05940 [Bacteroidales bacterium]|nr:hypothetical protein [Bacteroidales bacterium]